MVEWRVFAVSGSSAASMANGIGRVGRNGIVSPSFTITRDEHKLQAFEASFENRGASDTPIKRFRTYRPTRR